MKLGDKELAVVKELRLGGMSWDDVQEELNGMGVKVHRSSLILQCQRKGIRPKDGGGVFYESWCAPKSSMTREARRLRAYRARKRYGLVGSKNDIVETPTLSPSAEVVSLRAQEELGVGIIEPVIVSNQPVRLALPTEPETSVVSVARVSGSELGSVTGLFGVEVKSQVPTLTPVVSSQTLVREGGTKKVADETGETVASGEVNAPVVPVSGPEKVARAIPGIPAASDNTSGVPEVHASGRFMVIGEDGKERPETVPERKARMLQVARNAQEREKRAAQEREEQAERDRLDQLERDALYEEARRKTFGPLWGTKAAPKPEAPSPVAAPVANAPARAGSLDI